MIENDTDLHLSVCFIHHNYSSCEFTPRWWVYFRIKGVMFFSSCQKAAVILTARTSLSNMFMNNQALLTPVLLVNEMYIKALHNICAHNIYFF